MSPEDTLELEIAPEREGGREGGKEGGKGVRRHAFGTFWLLVAV